MDVFILDALPAKCEIEAEVRMEEGGDVFVRCRASRLRSARRRQWHKRASGWTGWFPYEGEPIHLTWSALVDLPREES